MKFLKITLYTILGFIGILLLLAVLTPILFKDSIKQKIDESIAESVDAKVYFDASKFDISLFQNFPDLTITMENFGVANNAPFEGDTLAAISSFQVSVNVMSAIFEDKIIVNSIHLNEPKIHVIVNEEGKANWDIAIPSEEKEEVVTPEDESVSLISIGEWKITDGNVIYDDATMPLMATIKKLNHTGSGEIADVYDLMTITSIQSLSVNFDSTQYLKENTLDIDMTLNLDLNNSKYTFKENTIKLNDFSFGFDGFFAMPDSLTNDMDITFKTKETAFKNILSLVPGVFLEGFEELKTSGNLAFDGFAKGKMVGDQLPTFGLNLLVNEGMFQYPDLPIAVKNVNIDLAIDNKDGVINNTIIDLKNFHLDMGTNPVDIKALVKGLDIMDIDANVKAKVNLADITKAYPIDGISMKGLFDADITAKGIYDSAQSILPVIDAKMVLSNGYLKSVDVPFPLENMQFATTATVPNMTEGQVHVRDFKVSVDGETFIANLDAHNFDDISYKMGLQGIVNLTKMTKVYPIEGMEIQGIMKIDTFSTSGTMSLIDAEQFDQLPTHGALQIQDFVYSDKESLGDKKFSIASSIMNFTPEQINLSSFKGKIGNSDLQLSGSILNYIPYIFKDHTLKGKLNFASTQFDVNEWMTEEEVPTETAVEEPLTVIEVPKNIDFVLSSTLDKVLYDNMDMTNMIGNIIVRDGIVRMQGINFDMLGGNIGMDGEYNAQDLAKPSFDYKLNIKNLAFKDAYTAFGTVQKFAPSAKNIDGAFSTNFRMSGGLGRDMMPVYETMNGGGLINIANAQLKNLSSLQKVSSALKLKKDVSNSKVANLILNAKIEKGRLILQPFDVNLMGMKTNVIGSTGMDGTIDYKMAMDIPAGETGQAFNSAIGNTGNSDVRVNFDLIGPSTDPAVKNIKSNAINNFVDDKKQEAKNVVNKKVEETKQEVKKEVKKEVDKKTKEVKKEVQNEVKNKFKDLKKRW